MSDEKKTNGWRTVFKVLGFTAAIIILLAVVALGLLAGACGLSRR